MVDEREVGFQSLIGRLQTVAEPADVLVLLRGFNPS